MLYHVTQVGFRNEVFDPAQVIIAMLSHVWVSVMEVVDTYCKLATDSVQITGGLRLKWADSVIRPGVELECGYPSFLRHDYATVFGCSTMPDDICEAARSSAADWSLAKSSKNSGELEGY